ncbi:MAG: hypoxanthine phosphoribosyltransferase [Bacteroidetes bacterium]|nr:hypoxanthine phosphoribosyltransferase [Bacteroidota bacterium]
MTVNEQVNRTTVCNGERFRLYLDESTIRDRVAELGRQISADYEGLRPVLVGVLNGAFIFLADLMREISGDCEVDFIKLSSYGESKISNGVVTELKAIDANLQGKHVLIIEDIVDTGLSMKYLCDRIQENGPASVKAVTLLHKAAATKVDVPLDYVGFEIDNLFVIGYGLDYSQLGRNLKDIYILDEDQ